MITIALSKGRIFSETMPILNSAGIYCEEDPETSRKLVLKTNDEKIQLIIVRASDVPTYVEWGGADLGIAGKDILDEYKGVGLYQPLNLNIAKCKMMVMIVCVGMVNKRMVMIDAKTKHNHRQSDIDSK